MELPEEPEEDDEELAQEEHDGGGSSTDAGETEGTVFMVTMFQSI